MKIICLCAALIVCASARLSAANCESLQPDLAAIAKTLAHGEVRSASRLLEPLADSRPDCPAVLLAQARVLAMTKMQTERMACLLGTRI
jgi:hypothetical protein